MIDPAKLVVLSACFSGFGKILGSNDGYGFPHALLSMGVRAFVGSLWKVNENASLIFMFTFYREMLSEKPNNRTVTIAQAFAIAQRQLRNMSRDSYHACIDQIILELQKCDPRLSKRVVNMSEQIFLLQLSKKRDDPARFADPLFWAPFVLTGDGAQVLTSLGKATLTGSPCAEVGPDGLGRPAPRL
jgi:CHAT domain-containing protein